MLQLKGGRLDEATMRARTSPVSESTVLPSTNTTPETSSSLGCTTPLFSTQQQTDRHTETASGAGVIQRSVKRPLVWHTAHNSWSDLVMPVRNRNVLETLP